MTTTTLHSARRCVLATKARRLSCWQMRAALSKSLSLAIALRAGVDFLASDPGPVSAPTTWWHSLRRSRRDQERSACLFPKLAKFDASPWRAIIGPMARSYLPLRSIRLQRLGPIKPSPCHHGRSRQPKRDLPLRTAAQGGLTNSVHVVGRVLGENIF